MDNKLVERKADIAGKEVKYTWRDEEIKLTPNMVKNYLVSGNKNSVTDEELIMFINLCRYQKLNPFLREAYLIKYGDKSPATMVVGKDVFTKRAENIPTCQGWKAGICVVNAAGELIEREGSLVLPNEKIVGGWALVYKANWREPFKHTVTYDEYEGQKADGSVTKQWLSMPGTMIRKVALVQTLRDAFPESFQGMYSPEELNIETPDQPILEAVPEQLLEVAKEEPPIEAKFSVDDIF